jgi:hypothetical protein
MNQYQRVGILLVRLAGGTVALVGTLGLYLVAASYVCAALFVFGGGIHNWGGSFGFVGFWLLAIGILLSAADMFRPIRRGKGKAGLVAAAILLGALFLFFRGC